MDVQDDFIVGIYNYCDRWCERCPFTGRCRMFADESEFEFERDHGPLTEPMRDRVARSLDALAVELDLALADVEHTAAEFQLPDIAPEHREIDERGRDYAVAAHQCLERKTWPDDPAATEARTVIVHCSFLAGGKIHRALLGAGEAGDLRSDANGSAKIALIVLDRLQAAWTTLALGPLGPSAEPFISDLAWLAAQMDRVFPIARRFLRPGFDEPADVANLEAGGW